MRSIPSISVAALLLMLTMQIASAQGPAGTKPKSGATIPPPSDLSHGIIPGDKSERDQQIFKALSETTEIESQEMPLTDLVDYLKTRHKIEIQLDNAALEDAGVALDTPITRNLHHISLRSALRIVLTEFRLSFEIRDEALVITTMERAKTSLEARVYPVGDLLDAMDEKHLESNSTRELIQAVVTSVAPTSWRDAGGSGSITYVGISRCVVVSQPYDVQEKVCDLLAAMRTAQLVEQTRWKQHAANDRELNLNAVMYWMTPDRWGESVAINPAQSKDPAARPTDKEKPAAMPSGMLGADFKLTDNFARAIRKTIEPASWSDNGGKGAIESVGIGLVVLQSRDVHRQIDQFLHSISGVSRTPQERD